MVKDAVTLLLGSETHLRDQVIRPLREKLFADAGQASLNEHCWDASREPISDLITHAQTAPFLSDKRLILADHVEAIKEADREAFRNSVQKTSQQHSIWILMTDERTVTRSAWLKSLAALGQSCDCATPYREGDIKGWIMKRFRDLGKSADSRVADVMMERVGKSITLLDLAVDRLVIYRKDAPSVTVADAEALLGRSAEENAFEILSSIKIKGAAAGIRMIRALRSEGVKVQEILSPLGFQFEQLLRVKNCLSQGLGAGDVAGKFFKNNSYRANQAAELARHLSGERLRKDLESLLDCEEKIKRGELQETEALEVCVLLLGEVEAER